MNIEDIQRHLQERSDFLVQTYKSILWGSPLVKQAAESSVKEIAKRASKETSVAFFLNNISVEDFLLVATAITDKKGRTFPFKVLKTLFGSVLLLIMAKTYNLDYATLKDLEKNDRDTYLEIGDAIVLAGLHLYLSSYSPEI